MGLKLFKNWPRLLFLVVGFFLFYTLDKFTTAQNFNEDLNISITATVPSVSTPPPSGSGGGGGAGGPVGPINPPVQSGATVTFSGRSYPNTTVTLLKDGQVVTATISGPDAVFSITINNLSTGSYIFSIYSEDKDGRRSLTLTYPISIVEGVITQVSGIFIAPTITVDKSTVKRGDSLSIFGQSAPASEVTIAIHSETEVFLKTLADAAGVFLYAYNTADLEEGSHITKARSFSNGSISEYGRAVNFSVGKANVINQDNNEGSSKSDMNKDGRVNIVDFSIMAYWYKRPSPPPEQDLNGDGKVDLVDFSIMAFHWTG